jgi:hypothetical protein
MTASDFNQNNMERIMYVLQRADGKFYWKSQNTSSFYDYREGFDNAFLFLTEKGAKSRMGYGCEGQKCKIRKVKVTLIDE